jgi:hypothetical protein
MYAVARLLTLGNKGSARSTVPSILSRIDFVHEFLCSAMLTFISCWSSAGLLPGVSLPVLCPAPEVTCCDSAHPRELSRLLRPISAWIFAIGLMMASLTAAILYYQLGHAPPQEPISGHFSQSWVEPTFLGLLWGLTSLGAMLLPAGVLKWNRKVLMVAVICWKVAGMLFVLFSAMNYFTHIGLLMNTSDSF